MLSPKKPKESFVTMTELVMPNDTNMLFNVMGGKMMHWMDIVSAIAAQRHSNHVVVTASVDTISFAAPIKLGYVVTLEAKVTRAFKTSMEVYIEVWGEDVPNKNKFKSNSAFFTFVALDKDGNKVEIPEIIPETEEEKVLFEGALQRRQMRLVLSGKMKAEDASELKNLFK
jgi:acyl-CoA hydrolase